MAMDTYGTCVTPCWGALLTVASIVTEPVGFGPTSTLEDTQ